jgi:hypothetical protein
LGPPISGRFDVDFLQLWAAAKTSIGPKTVRLLGNYGPNHTWVDDLQFQHVRDCGERQLYLLDQGSAGLSTEFVIKLEAADGQVYYDNNGGSNYKLKQYGGRGTSAVAGEGAIWSFPGFVKYQLLKRTSTVTSAPIRWGFCRRRDKNKRETFDKVH